MLRKIALSTALAVGLALAGASAAFAGTTVEVTLSDQGSSAEMGTDLGMAMGGDKSKAVMSVTATPAEIPAGEVTFHATNASKELVHEMILVRIDDQTKPLPYIDAEGRVDEDAAGHLGEVSELDPGKDGSLTLTLTPGTYMLFCNLPPHYAAGMWTLVTVK